MQSCLGSDDESTSALGDLMYLREVRRQAQARRHKGFERAHGEFDEDPDSLSERRRRSLLRSAPVGGSVASLSLGSSQP